MKFKFRLERVMDHKKVERDLALRDYAEAQRLHEEGREKLRSLHKEILEARQFEVMTIKKGGTNSENLKWSSFFIEGQIHKIDSQRKINRVLVQNAERKQEVLVEKAREVKTFEKLKDKTRERFKKEEQKQDRKSIDEIVVMSSGRDLQKIDSK